jgi:hypothetical protein
LPTRFASDGRGHGIEVRRGKPIITLGKLGKLDLAYRTQLFSERYVDDKIVVTTS